MKMIPPSLFLVPCSLFLLLSSFLFLLPSVVEHDDDVFLDYVES